MSKKQKSTSDYSELWGISKGVVFLNHGSFGACPKEVLKFQAGVRKHLEEEPMRFFLRESDALLLKSRKILADFVGANADDLVFVPNVTAGVNTVFRSLKFKKNSRILITNHTYFACRNTVLHIAGKYGLKVDIADIRFPVRSEDDVVDDILSAVHENTCIALIDHVTSPTGLVFPVKRIVDELKKLGIDTLVDGAHSPGMIPLDINDIGAAYFTGNCHKWICSPKGAGFLVVREDHQADIFPLSVSHLPGDAYTEMTEFQYRFSWSGTSDVSPYISVGESIRYMNGLMKGGWPAIMKHNRTLALKAREILCRYLETAPPCPESMIGTLAAVHLPDDNQIFYKDSPVFEPLYQQLISKYNIEAVTMYWPLFPKRLLRISAQLYNCEEDYVYLAEAVKSILSGK